MGSSNTGQCLHIKSLEDSDKNGSDSFVSVQDTLKPIVAGNHVPLYHHDEPKSITCGHASDGARTA